MSPAASFIQTPPHRAETLAVALSSATTTAEALGALLDFGLPLLGAETALAYLLSDDGQWLELGASRGVSAENVREHQRISTQAPLPLPEVLRTATPLWIESLKDLEAGWPAHAPAARVEGRHAFACIPLFAEDLALGAVVFGFQGDHPFSELHRSAISSLGAQCAQALRRVQLHEEAIRSRERTQRLQELTAALAAALTPTEVARVAVMNGRRATGAAASFAWLLAEDGSTLELAAGDGYTGPRLDALRRFPRTAKLPLCDALSTGRPVLITGRAKLRSEFPLSLAGGDSPYSAWAALPFVVGGQSMGGLSLSFSDERTFTAEDRAMLETIVGQVSVALERARLLQAEREARAHAEAADRRKDEFLAMLSHELRNPLSPIITALHLMRMRAPGVCEKERFILERQVNHLVRLVDDLLDVSRITRGKLELKREPLELHQVVAKALETAGPLIEERRHRLSVAVPSTGLPIFGDEHRLAQVFANLLTNAARYTEPAGDIEVTAERDQTDAILQVRDNGIGIPPEMHQTLFEPFVQGPRGSDRSQGGLGLGLAIVHNLVTLHGGRVRVESAGQGRGSTFVVRLPLRDSVEAGAMKNGQPLLAPSADAGRTRVLLVDDNRDAVEGLAELLATVGYETRVTFDPAAALRLASDFAPDVALIDIGLPVMDGYELAQRLRELPGLSQLRLIAVTGYSQPSDRQRSAAAGFSRHLVKPVGLEEVAPAIEQVLREADRAAGLTYEGALSS